MTNSSLVTIDGAHGEGGGQILRTSLTLSVLTGRPVKIENIRAGRSKPGLQPQHLAAVRASAAISAAQLGGAEIGSTQLLFEPLSHAVPGTYHFEIGTAGAATLVAQTVLLPLALASAPSHITITGGTHVPFAPTAEYLSEIYCPLLSVYGLEAQFAFPHIGFFPRGGGSVQLSIQPSAQLLPMTHTERGYLKSLTAQITTAHLPPDIAARGIAALRERLKLPAEVRIESREVPSSGPGAAVFLIAECEGVKAGFSGIGSRGKRMESVIAEACAAFDFWYQSGAACDEHLADQIALPMALVPALSRWTTSRVTDHLRSVLWVLQHFLPIEVHLEENFDGSGTISLHGAALL